MPKLPAVVITAYADVGSAVASMRAGAVDYLAKPFDHKRLLSIIRANLSGPATPLPLRNGTTSCATLEETMGKSAVIQRLADDVRRVALSNFNVLVMGETGTGIGVTGDPRRQCPAWRTLRPNGLWCYP